MKLITLFILSLLWVILFTVSCDDVSNSNDKVAGYCHGVVVYPSVARISAYFCKELSQDMCTEETVGELERSGSIPDSIYGIRWDETVSCQDTNLFLGEFSASRPQKLSGLYHGIYNIEDECKDDPNTMCQKTINDIFEFYDSGSVKNTTWHQTSEKGHGTGDFSLFPSYFLDIDSSVMSGEILLTTFYLDDHRSNLKSQTTRLKRIQISLIDSSGFHVPSEYVKYSSMKISGASVFYKKVDEVVLEIY